MRSRKSGLRRAIADLGLSDAAASTAVLINKQGVPLEGAIWWAIEAGFINAKDTASPDSGPMFTAKIASQGYILLPPPYSRMFLSKGQKPCCQLANAQGNGLQEYGNASRSDMHQGTRHPRCFQRLEAKLWFQFEGCNCARFSPWQCSFACVACRHALGQDSICHLCQRRDLACTYNLTGFSRCLAWRRQVCLGDGQPCGQPGDHTLRSLRHRYGRPCGRTGRPRLPPVPRLDPHQHAAGCAAIPRNLTLVEDSVKAKMTVGASVQSRQGRAATLQMSAVTDRGESLDHNFCEYTRCVHACIT